MTSEAERTLDYSNMTDEELLRCLRAPGSEQERGLEALCAKFVRPGMEIVEVGTFAGAGARIIARALKGEGRLYCVDNWEASWDGGPDVPRRAEALFDSFSATSPVVVKLKLESAAGAACFADGSLDVVYVDASHEEENVRRDFLLWKKKVKPGGVFAGHDYGQEMHPGVKKVVDEVLGEVLLFEDSSWAYIC